MPKSRRKLGQMSSLSGLVLARVPDADSHQSARKAAAYITVDISEKQLRKSTASFQKIFPKWKFCLCAPITCSPSCCLRRVTSRHGTLFIFPDHHWQFRAE